MLEQLSISNLGLIASANLELCDGLVVITGETGAGKTLFLDAIRSLAGAKPEIVAAMGTDSARVEAILKINSSLEQMLSDLDAHVEDGAVSISRAFPKEGRSKAILGGRSVPAGSLEELSYSWLAIHGQHDSYRLMKPQSHRELLDRFGKGDIAKALENHRERYQAWVRLRNQYDQVTKERNALLKDAEGIKADVALVDSLNLREGEDVEIASTIDRLGRVEQVRAAISEALQALNPEEASIGSALSAAEKSIAQALPQDVQAQDVVSRLHSFKNELNDLVHEITSISQSLDVDPSELDALMLRQRQIKTLLLRHGPTLNDVLAWTEQSRMKLALIDPDGKALEELRIAADKALSDAKSSAAKLSTLRKKFAQELSSLVTAELTELALPHADFEAQVSDADLSELGSDRVDFVFSANPGLPKQPIEKAASGGELSRLMLAIEVVLSDGAPPAVMVFDEVDAGVAGAAAIAVGQRLARLAKTSQVLVVTHLAQIAAFADQHFTVVKSSSAGVTTTDIAEISASERETEIARMLAGLEDSEFARAHASELLSLAKADR